MGALPTTHPVTVAEFELLAEQSPQRLELIGGEVREKPMASARHREFQYNTYEPLSPALLPEYRAAIEIEFRTTPEQNLPRVDVAAISRDRLRSAAAEGYIQGAPEMVIEVLSPSNRSANMVHRRRLCFNSGCLEFWMIDPETRAVEVWTPDSIGRLFSDSDLIASPLFGAAKLPVSQIFD